MKDAKCKYQILQTWAMDSIAVIKIWSASGIIQL